MIMATSTGAIAQNLNACMQQSQAGNYQLAFNCFSGLQKSKPDDATVNYFMFKTLQLEKEELGSNTDLDASLSKIPVTSSLYEIARIRILQANGKFDDAYSESIKLLQKSKKEAPENLAELAEIFIKSKKPYLQFADSILKIASGGNVSKNTSIIKTEGQLMMARGDYGGALNNFNLILDKEPGNSYVHFLKGTSYQKIKSLSSAKEELEIALKQFPEFPFALVAYAEVLFESGDAESGIVQYNNYFKLKPNDIKAYINYSSFLYANKKYSESLSIANKILELDSKNVSALKIKAYCQYEMENNSEAISSFNNYLILVDTSKTDSKDYEYLGKLYQKSGNDSLASINLLLAAKSKGARPEFFSETLSYFSKKGKFEEVITIYKLKSDLYKTTSADSYQCGRALLSVKEYEAADSLFRRVCELQPNWPNGFLMRGNANANLDPGSKDGKAKPYYEQYLVLAEGDTANASKLKSGMIEANKYLGYYYYLNKDIERSKSHWNKVLLLDPADKQAIDVIKQLK